MEKDAEEGLSWWENNSVAVVEEDANAGCWGSNLGKLKLVENGVSMGIARGEVSRVGKDAEAGMGNVTHGGR